MQRAEFSFGFGEEAGPRIQQPKQQMRRGVIAPRAGNLGGCGLIEDSEFGLRRARMRRDAAIGSRDAEPSVTPVAVSRWNRAASAFTGVCAVAVVFAVVVPYVIGGPAGQPLPSAESPFLIRSCCRKATAWEFLRARSAPPTW